MLSREELTMPSPFPGMNPYLEQDDVWHDFHEAFLPHLAEVIAAQLAAHYIVKIDEHVYIHEPSAEQRIFLGRGDVVRGLPATVAQQDTATATRARERPGPGGASRGGCRRTFVPGDPRPPRPATGHRDRTAEPRQQVQGPDREQYLGKRGSLLASSAHLVEIDLLRGGPRMPFATVLPGCAYYVLVSRMEKRPQADFWPIQLPDPLPLIPIPLREPDPDATLDLQAALHHVYDAARYANYIYEGVPQPALSPEDVRWAQQFVPGLS